MCSRAILLASNAYLKQLAGVSKDYYLGIVDDLNDKEIEIKSKEIKNLCLSVIDK